MAVRPVFRVLTPLVIANITLNLVTSEHSFASQIYLILGFEALTCVRAYLNLGKHRSYIQYYV